MRRMLILALAVLSLMAVMPADVLAQAAAPTPQVTINGLIQHVNSYRFNPSDVDFNAGRTNDTTWLSRSRLRLDVTGQIGAVIGRVSFETDMNWGQVGATACGAASQGNNCGWGLGTDTADTAGALGWLEYRHLWTQTPITGKDSLLPFIPVDTVGRFGAQPFEVTYKIGVFATTDFPGVDLRTTITPNIRTQFIYAQLEEQHETAARGFTRGDDFAIIFGVDITPLKGLDIKPIYSYIFLDGVTQGQVRTGRGGIVAANFTSPNTGGAGLLEHRHTIGFDARYRMGPITIEPTFLYQWGSRETVIAAGQGHLGPVASRPDADISAFFLDVRGGYRVGPLLVEGMMMWTSGNRARDNLTKNVNFYQPLATDATYYATWANLYALNVDFTRNVIGAQDLGAGIGYDRYGRVQVGLRAFYDLTPALTFNFKTTTGWTDKSADTDGFVVAGGGIQPALVDRVSLRSARPEGDSRYLGTEFDVGFMWRFAPAITFEAEYGYRINGPAFGLRAIASQYNAGAGLPINKDRDVNDTHVFAARLAYSF